MVNKDQWQILTRLPNGDELSTVKLPDRSARWETCMFLAKGDCYVVGSHRTETEAIRVHTFLVSHELAHDAVKRQVVTAQA